MVEKIGNLKPGMESISIVVRVLQVSEPKDIQTKNGPRTISEVMVGDETGRAKLTIWGKQEEPLKEGSVVKIDNVWTTAFRGQVQLNAGSKSTFSESDEEIPEESEIPETIPEAPQDYAPPRRNFNRGGGRRFGGYRQGGYNNYGGRRRNEGEEE
ncbi:single-stranded DNA-binding protein [Sulfuracidifex metallicus]|uniref:Single-stranded DNA-binding protein n=1 Tax=Sulfuracidifex metallicus DSM 6482 = JCM 9184 TaxID=523847 RepID=A0A6A9QKW1_SULME|nr:single-stranded DNA-binding protein [Sulfuracidifex metallicus]MUN29264.1 single-stranded DNA-binding protein [Sulfuracidifex metallicus DSM 6482 = JCM 9184]WOE50218.1 single-stranded DNA-binding protein [Sulfuracidifex metallicus DSM 6482 = JCM 9184]